MADAKISALSALLAASIVAADIIPIVDVSAGTSGSKKTTIQDLMTVFTGSTDMNGATVTTSKPILDLSQTWNAGAVTFTGWKLNVTDTASNAASLLMDLQVGGSSKFKIAKDGSLTLGSGGDTIKSVGGRLDLSASSIYSVSVTAAKVVLGATTLEFASGNGGNNSGDTILARDAANTLALRNSTSAQAFNIYNTFTDASNYERLAIKWASNVATIEMEKAGTGSNRTISIISGAGTALQITASSSLCASFGADLSAFKTAFGVGSTASAPDWFIFRRAAGIAAITANSSGTTGATVELLEQTAPAAPASDRVRIYAEDNGSGKTRLMALFPTGAAQQIAIEP